MAKKTKFVRLNVDMVIELERETDSLPGHLPQSLNGEIAQALIRSGYFALEQSTRKGTDRPVLAKGICPKARLGWRLDYRPRG